MNLSKPAATLIAALLSAASVTHAVAADTTPPVITHVAVAHAPEGQAVPIRARIEDSGEIFAPSVYVRQVGATDFDNIAMRKVLDAYEAIVPAEQVDKNLEYFIEAFDEMGNGPTREGSPESPLLIKVYDPADGPPTAVGVTPDIPTKVVPPPPPPPNLVTPQPEPEDDDDSIVGTWWFWTIVGVVAAGAATGVVLATRSDPLVDSVTIQVVGPDPTAGL